ncbi:hypothetical protein Y900_015710 [Mycolicibacterium aromaticivorans JS19b1 = JCM 16368]|uniref:Uncharacterized protein n=1 Tax=Mycolicibacterium aromaticivorans JS19b1 = JCM 16368 TaxID=1440774 RepID=A0A064CNR8_9MYCO|nr:hypothetical protein Y900_015710 [Mycolicibacterium aromaticivorans JS19b1 = JCM 16368]
MGQGLGGFGVNRTGRNDHELVTTEAGDHVAVAGLLAQPVGECLDEPVARVVTEVIVDRLEAVEVEEQHRDRAFLTDAQPFIEMGEQCAAVVQSGQVIVLSQVAQLVFGDHPRLHLGEQGGDRLECVQLLRRPVLNAELDETDASGCGVAGQQRNRCHRGQRHARALLNEALVLVLGNRIGAEEDGFLCVLGGGEDWVRVSEVDQFEGVWVALVWWPLCDQSGRPDAVLVVAEKAHIHAEGSRQLAENLLANTRGCRGIDSHQLRRDMRDEILQAVSRPGLGRCGHPAIS